MPPILQQVGQIKLVQVQQTPLKKGNVPNRVYDPAPLLRVASLRLTAQGVFGITADGQEVMDVHHPDHPQSRTRNGKNGISVGLTGHYDAIRARYGEQHADGCAGENIIIHCHPPYELEDLEKGLVIKNLASGKTIHFRVPKAMAPCRPFSRYVTGNPSLDGEELAAILNFLDNGRRGFFLELDDPASQPVIQPGDRVFIVLG